MIRELKGEECRMLRPLWEKVFFEDSKEFTDYYFEEKAKHNHAFIICMEEKEGEIKAAGIRDINAAAMLHLSPYNMEMRIGDQFCTLKINYIVGVATEESQRRKGYMGILLKASMDFMYGQGQPFAFLMPASPEIYEPYQFVYIYDKKTYKVQTFPFSQAKARSGADDLYGSLKISALQEYEIPSLADYANHYLKENYDLFIMRDKIYYETLAKELKAQNGTIYLIRKPGEGLDSKEAAGYFLYTEEEGKADIQEAIFEDTYKEAIFNEKSGFLQEADNKPIIMARIVNVQAMLSLLRIKKSELGTESNIMLTVEVFDPMLEGNNGIWECCITREAAVIRKRKEMKTPVCSAAIDKLTSWIFGYRQPEECFIFPREEVVQETLCKLKSLKVFSEVFINEIV